VAAGFTFTLKIQRGSSGNEVLELQKFLNNAGYPCGTPDGKFGVKTKASLIKFQIANNLTGDGTVGAKTRAVLNK
jgi:peptidoglycan hydrolase-like protein with peptidoglycan-binding domain